MKRILLVGVLSLLLISPVLAQLHACSLCQGMAQRDTLGMEFERAPLVLFGPISNPRFNNQPGAAPGSGSTDLRIEKVLKDTTGRGPWKEVVLPRYLPVLDAKAPPRMLFFCDVNKNGIDPYHGRTASPALLEYLQTTLSERTKPRAQALLAYAKHLDHADPSVADDAFHEFAKSKDEDVGQASKLLDRTLVRRLVQIAKDDPDRLGLFAFLMGGCGDQTDAKSLRAMLDPPDMKVARALDGVLAGYIQLAPKEGWTLAYKLLADRKQHFLVRFAAVRTLRFYHGWQPKETQPHVLYGLSLIVPDGELADLAIEDLRQWKLWDLTTSILSQYGKASHTAPITKRSIVRYALTCPLPEAREFVARVRRSDPEMISEMEEFLQIERK